MEISKGSITTFKGGSTSINQDSIPLGRCVDGIDYINMERDQQLGVRDAKVGQASIWEGGIG